MATSKSWKDKDTGNMAEKTEWHTVNFWGRLAEVAAEYLRKGKPVYVEGELETRRWTDRNGVERFSTEIRALELQLLGSRNRDPAEARAPGDGAGPYGDDNIPY
jgi:single-strand DNA-binding protein